MQCNGIEIMNQKRINMEPLQNQIFIRWEEKIKWEMAGKPPVSPREFAIIELLVQGSTTKEIASHLNLSVGTIESHMNHIYEKLNINKANQLFQWYMTRLINSK
jgi:DNA-binding NarL/FixJ family response regulator